jgi:hypothetical protein
MAYVLLVPTFQFGNPGALIVLVKPYDPALHRNYWTMSID